MRATGVIVVTGTLVAGTIAAFALLAPGRLQPGELHRPGGTLSPAETLDWEAARLGSLATARESGLKLAAAVGALTAALLAWGRMELSRDERSSDRVARALERVAHFSDRYTAAVEQLGSGPHVQLGGIYALERLGIESEDHRQVVVEVLCAFIRERAGSRAPDASTLLRQPATVQAALAVLDRNRSSWDDIVYDLGDASLVGAQMTKVHLSGARFTRARLAEAHLNGADLARADLTQADLSGAHMTGVGLRAALLSDANLRGADLLGADLSGARLSRADLSQALAARANLRQARLVGAILRSTDLSDADLSGADLTRADLTATDLRGATLTGANLSGVHYRVEPAWPTGFAPVPSSRRRPARVSR